MFQLEIYRLRVATGLELCRVVFPEPGAALEEHLYQHSPFLRPHCSEIHSIQFLEGFGSHLIAGRERESRWVAEELR